LKTSEIQVSPDLIFFLHHPKFQLHNSKSRNNKVENTKM